MLRLKAFYELNSLAGTSNKVIQNSVILLTVIFSSTQSSGSPTDSLRINFGPQVD